MQAVGRAADPSRSTASMFVGIPLLVLCFWAIVAMLGITCVVAVVQAF